MLLGRSGRCRTSPPRLVSDQGSNDAGCDLDELIDQGVVDVRSGRPRDKGEALHADAQPRIVQAKDVVAGKLTPVDDAPVPGDGTDLTQPDDVLVTTMHKVRAVLDTDGGRTPSTGVYRIRVLNAELSFPAYLAEVISGAWNDRLQTGSTIKRAPIKELEIPLMSLEHQQIVSAGMTAVRSLQQNAADLASESGQAALGAVGRSPVRGAGPRFARSRGRRP